MTTPQPNTADRISAMLDGKQGWMLRDIAVDVVGAAWTNGTLDDPETVMATINAKVAERLTVALATGELPPTLADDARHAVNGYYTLVNL